MFFNGSFLYNQLLCSNVSLDEYSSEMRKVVLVNILLIISGTILLTFALYNLFIEKNHTLFIIDLIAFFVSTLIFYNLRRTLNVERTSIVTTLSIFAMMVAVVYFGKGNDFTLVWTVFFPVFAIFLNGSKRGILITFVFYIVILYLTYQGLGVWQEGMWNESSYTRFIVASIGITIIVFFFEVSLEKAHEALALVRRKEKDYIKILEEYSITDPLTQVYNRRYLNVQFDRLFEKAKKNKSFFALYIFDVDYFKQYNDTFGHVAGDTALQKTTEVLTNEVFKREVDYIFRLGGEEFCGLLIADDIEKIKYIIEKARAAIEGLQISHPKNPHKVLTASFGVCIINDFEIKNFDKMYKYADTALYNAKEQGRNCIVGTDRISTL
ncbi:diguanylate cyclase [Sulfurimonas sp. C5]|uniref:GGDEF domain-containing protein n=1 Tax=Sulfurimonas sp. C5 TaxID=3036947 RepID=UPI002453A635|nr:diguanylate cyclase [Sulfurimonas sp. C5]